ncbi:hypothetical protein [Rhodopirellula halodulae]|uniref:hypothetical protein n=1 Tax=Rhodopirellula halodulae TaxID=2894198 RepID=UPI0028F44365|nr:hypothetical protein [Rhodopirellula sp. JC737]
MIKSLEEMLGKTAVVNYQDAHVADMKSTWADIAKAKALLDWEPKVGLEDGLRKCVDWYKSNCEWWQKLPGICETAWFATL